MSTQETTRVKAYWRDSRFGQSAEPSWGTITAKRGVYYDIKFDNGKFQRKIPKDWITASLEYNGDERRENEKAMGGDTEEHRAVDGDDDDDEDPLKKYGKPGLRIQSIFALPGGPVFGEEGEVRRVSDAVPGKISVRFLKSGQRDMWPWQIQKIVEADKNAPGWTARKDTGRAKSKPKGSDTSSYSQADSGMETENATTPRTTEPPTHFEANGANADTNNSTDGSPEQDKEADFGGKDSVTPLGDRLLREAKNSYAQTTDASQAPATDAAGDEPEEALAAPLGGALVLANDQEDGGDEYEETQNDEESKQAELGPNSRDGHRRQITMDWAQPVMDAADMQKRLQTGGGAAVLATIWVCPKCRWENGAKREKCHSCGYERDGAKLEKPDLDAVIVYTGVLDDGEEIEIEVAQNLNPDDLTPDTLFGADGGAEPSNGAAAAKKKVTKRQLRIIKEAQRKLNQKWEFRHDAQGNYMPISILEHRTNRSPSITESTAMREALEHLEAMMPRADDDSDVVSVDTDIKPGTRVKLKVICPGQFGRVDRHIILRDQSRWGVTLDSGKRYAVLREDFELVEDLEEAPPAPKEVEAKGAHLWRNVQPEVATKLEHKLLFAASREGHLDEVRRLIDMGVNLEAQDPTCHDYTALHHATWQGHGQGRVVNCPGEHGLVRFNTPSDTYYCDICQAENFKKGSTMYGCKDCHWDVCPECVKPSYSVVALLVTSKANIEARDRSGNTPLVVSCAKGHSNCVSLLINGRANINTPDHNGWTPLMVAARYGQEECVKLLLNARANLQLKNKEGAKAIRFAENSNHPRVVKMIEDCCSNCKGSGVVGWLSKTTCKVCGGSGYASKMTPLDSVQQPANI